jgi:MFS family permease
MDNNKQVNEKRSGYTIKLGFWKNRQNNMSKSKTLTNTVTNTDHLLSKGVPATKGSNHTTRILLALCAVTLLVSYIETMILPGVPIIQKDFATTTTIASWITSMVLLVAAVVSPIFGKLADVYGKKRLIVITLVFYTIGVAIAGFSTSIYMLIFARAIQGVGAAMVPLSYAYLTDVFPKGKLATAQGAIAGSAAISTALGFVIGSYVVQTLGWQYAFHTAAILSVILFIIVLVVLKEGVKPTVKSKIDYVGAVLLSAGFGLVLLYATEGSILGWLSTLNLIFLIAGLILVGSFFIFENKVAVPLIQLKLLKIRNVLLANLITIVTGMANFLVFFAVIYYAELPAPFGLGFDAFATGLTLAPGTIVMLITGPLAGKLLPKTGPKPILVTGASISILSFVLFMINRGSQAALAIDAMLAFAGIVALIVPIVNMISLSLPEESIAVGQGLNQSLKKLGSAIAPVLTTTIMASFTQPLTRIVNGKTIVVGAVPSASAFNIIFSVGIVLAVICILLSLAIKNGALKKSQATKQP